MNHLWGMGFVIVFSTTFYHQDHGTDKCNWIEQASSKMQNKCFHQSYMQVLFHLLWFGNRNLTNSHMLIQCCLLQIQERLTDMVIWCGPLHIITWTPTVRPLWTGFLVVLCVWDFLKWFILTVDNIGLNRCCSYNHLFAWFLNKCCIFAVEATTASSSVFWLALLTEHILYSWRIKVISLVECNN